MIELDRISARIEKNSTPTNQQEVANLYRKHSKTTQYTLFSGAHGPYTEIDHVLNIRSQENLPKHLETK